jgi:hypothetical protein
MAQLSISEAARVTGVSRMLLYRYIKAGKLSRTPDGLIDTAELLRAGLLLQQSDVTPSITVLHDVTPTRDTLVTPVTPSVTTETHTLERLVDVLQRELDAARERETLLLHMLSQMQQQQQRLLDMPRATPTLATGPTATRSRAERGAMRQRIVALLQAHPEGLSPTQIRQHLGVEHLLANTVLAMARDGLLRRIAPGVYVAV